MDSAGRTLKRTIDSLDPIGLSEARPLFAESARLGVKIQQAQR